MLSHIFDGDITHIFTCGLATDFCVGMTSLDSAEHGLPTFVVEDACRGVAEESCAVMRKKMMDAGCEMVTTTDVEFIMDRINVDDHIQDERRTFCKKNVKRSAFCHLI